ncbi:hypothetical protein [Streptomyces xanthii]|uniref:Uncharacterized protein n=1 Tax=Streptomyces xanthii TaxID=2768069 RepID=A0A7H1BDL3_9ACTN|nr:hypothetical protein [Streptomyces xanthii]QNS06818.1 hypothetical protein IAG42_26680 [Streptomyces xanthii]
MRSAPEVRPEGVHLRGAGNCATSPHRRVDRDDGTARLGGGAIGAHRAAPGDERD